MFKMLKMNFGLPGESVPSRKGLCSWMNSTSFLIFTQGGRSLVLPTRIPRSWMVLGWWMGSQGDASTLGWFFLSCSAWAGEGNNLWAFLFWKVPDFHVAENWDWSGCAGTEQGKQPCPWCDSVVDKQPHWIFRAFTQAPFIRTVFTSFLFLMREF